MIFFQAALLVDVFDPYHVSALCFPVSISKTTLSPLEFRGEQFYCYSTTWCSERYRSSSLNYFGYNWANPDFLSQTVLPSGETTLTGLLQEREETKNKRNWQKSRRPGKREGAMALTFPARRPTGCPPTWIEGSLDVWTRAAGFGAWIVGAYCIGSCWRLFVPEGDRLRARSC